MQIFTNWANFILSQRGISISSIAEDLSDGLVLIHLVELLIGTCLSVASPSLSAPTSLYPTHIFNTIGRSVGRYNKRPRLIAHKLENVGIALAFLERYGVAVTTDVNGNRFVFIFELIFLSSYSDCTAGDQRNPELVLGDDQTVSTQRQTAHESRLAVAEQQERSANS